ncbi:MAG TPA: alpha-hydroxy acid oxidase [Streptosporangiaceae bacterium]|nr:alpha-hydroxy acid oxidase [Streptosporangiaceae bacterium]
MTGGLPGPCSLADFEQSAAAVLPGPVWDFLAGGSGGERTLTANRAALDRIFVVPRVLRDVSGCSTAATMLGKPVSMPVAVAPVAYHRLFHPDGELASARAAKAARVPFTVSTLSSVPLEEVAAVGGAVWFQLYWLRDKQAVFELVARAEDAGCEALMLTVDVPWMGRRLRDVRNEFTLPADVQPANLAPRAGSAAGRRVSGGSALSAHTSQAFSASVTWADLTELRARTPLPLIVKGVLAAQDAVRAAECGADAVVVSNHGGRQLDAVAPAIDMLGNVCAEVAGRCEVVVDSGIRSGTDVLKALALGATGVLLGRPLIWGLAAAGEAGALQVIELLRTEIRDALGLAGCVSPGAASHLGTVREPGS